MKMELSAEQALRAIGAKLHKSQHYNFNMNNFDNNNSCNNNSFRQHNNRYFDIMSEDLDFEDECDFYREEKSQFPPAHSLSSSYGSNSSSDEDWMCKELVPLSNQIQNMSTENLQLDPTTLRTTLRRNTSFDRCFFQPNERKVLVLYTGGTIGMKSFRGALICAPNMLEQTVRSFPHLHDAEYAKVRFADAVGENGKTPLILPEIPGENHRLVYTIYEYDPLLDSSNMTMDDWVRIATDIKENYTNFDGFVVLHGTDTLSYTASALSFMMENLGKSVVVTGSQIPLFESRSDGRDNFLGALIMAGSYIIPEVTCYFGHRLFRGNRISKVSADSLQAFDSPNMSPLATMGINISINYQSIFRPLSISPFQLNTSLNRNVGLLRLFPSITPEAVKVFLQPPTMGVVLQTYGAGNFPTNRIDLLKEFEEASRRGVLIVNCTQCGHGTVSAIYETGKTIEAAGLIPGHDMTPEACLTKLSFVLGQTGWSLEKKREMMQCSIRGELTKVSKVSTSHQILASARREYLQERRDFLCGGNTGYPGELLSSPTSPSNQPQNGAIAGGHDVVNRIVRIVAASLRMTSPEEVEGVKRILAPSLSCALVAQAIQASDNEFQINSLDALFGETESEISLSDVGTLGRTPLHFAAALNDVPAVEFLLKKGSSVHCRDARGFSPLREAIEANSHNVIPVLRQCGAHLTLESFALGAELCLAASKGDLKRLQSFLLAGADLNQVDPCNRTALAVATEAGQRAIVQFLLECHVDPSPKNLFGQSPLDIARLINRQDIVNLFSSVSNINSNSNSNFNNNSNNCNKLELD